MIQHAKWKAGTLRILGETGDAAFEKSRLILLYVASFVFGNAAYFGLTFEPDQVVLAAICLILAGIALGVKRGEGLGIAAGVCWSVLSFCVGLGYAQQNTALTDTNMLRKEGWYTIDGTIGKVERLPDAVRVRLFDVRPVLGNVEDAGTADHFPGSVRLRTAGRDFRPMVGERVRLRARLSKPSPPVAPGAFDFQRWAYFEGIGAVGFAIKPFNPVETYVDKRKKMELIAPDNQLSIGLTKLRDRISLRIRESLSGQTGAVAAALLVGDRSGLSEQTNELLRETGLAHLLAISGLHMGLVAGTIFFLVRAGLAAIPALALRLPLKKIAACIAFTAAFTYLLLAGAPVPTQRAFIMYGIMLVAILLDREPVSLRLVAAAALSVVVLRPFSVVGASFQMSFVAVIALVAVYEWWSSSRATGGGADGRILAGERGVMTTALLYLLGVIVTSLIVSIATAPIVAYHFQQIPTLGALANVFAIPITAFVTMPAGVVALLCLPFGAEAPALWVMGWGIETTLWLAELVRGSGLSAMKTTALGNGGLVLALAGFCWLVIWRSRWRLLGIVPILAACLVWSVERPPDILVSGDGRLVAANVDQLGPVFSDGTSGRFTRTVWKQRLNVSNGDRTISSVETAPRARSGCDEWGCILTVKGRQIAFPSSSEALAEDCQRADAVIWPHSAPEFCSPSLFLVERKDILQGGGLAIWIDGEEVKIQSVNSVRGERPWTHMTRK